MIVPQSMSYAKLAGLPVQYGLYSSLTPLIVYAISGGTSPQLAVGSLALVSLLLNSGITSILENKGIDNNDSDLYQSMFLQLAVQTSFLVACCMMILSCFRWLGAIITSLLSRAVISGFTTGAEIIIATSQVKYILGYTASRRSDRLHLMLLNYWKQKEHIIFC